MAERDESRHAGDDESIQDPPAQKDSDAGPYPALMDRQLLTPTAPLAPGAALRVYPMPPPPAVPARWAEDPMGRHQWRWWDGIGWTEHVADDGEVARDPLE